MRQSTCKSEMKLPISTPSENPSRKDCSSTSPTFARESYNKKSVWEGGSHIFGVPPSPAVVTPQKSSHNNSSMMTMDHSLLSPRTSSQSIVLDRMNESCSASSIGLPSDYPLHRKNTSFSSVALEEELEDFDVFLDESISFERGSLHTSLSERIGGDSVETNSFGTLGTSGTTSTNCNNGPKKKRHRRMHSDLVFSFDTLAGTTKFDQAHHRRHNYALGQKEFNESVLTELFGDVGITEVRS